jgi:hypothetical protein
MMGTMVITQHQQKNVSQVEILPLKIFPSHSQI